MLADVSSEPKDAGRVQRLAALDWNHATRDLESVPACNLCTGTRFAELSRRDRYGFAARAQACLRCGLIFLSPRLTPAEYAEFYAVAYRPLVSAYHGRLIDAETVQDDQRAYAVELVEFLRIALPHPPATVLDVGGSTGIVAGAVRTAFGSAATVLDPAPDELAVAQAEGMETIAGFAETADYGGRTFELVLLCQTIDHLLDVAATLHALRGALARGGHLFVDVLDIGFMARRTGSIEGAVKIDHPYYLTHRTALAYFELVGLAPVAERLSQDGHWGFLLAPSAAAEPDWDRLGPVGDAFLEEIWRLRAHGLR